MALMRTDGPFHVEPLPPYATARSAVAEAVAALRPPARVLVSDTATRRMVEAGGQWVPYRWDVAPYMREPGDTTLSRRFDSVVFIGPARSSKSEGLIINPLVHAILAQPRKVAVFSPTKGAAQEWSEGMLDPLIAESPELRSRQATGKGADNIFTKRFRGGLRLTIDWPVEDKLSQRSLDLVLSTDHDKTELDARALGGVFSRMRKRTEAAQSRGMAVAESSPRFPVLDETWTPSTPHEAPPCDGIVGLYNAGSRGRLYWTCPDCREAFIPAWECMRWPEGGSIGDRAARAYLECPHCGAVIDHRQKADLNGAAFWLHEDEGGALVPLSDLSRKVATASYWLPAPAAALAPWSRIVARMLAAEEAFRLRGDESALQADTNVELGLPYLPRTLGEDTALSETKLRASATGHAWGTCPEGTAFVTVAVDVQRGRFVVQVEAWAPDLSRVLVDRFDLVAPPEDADRAGERAIDPARRADDWRALEPLLSRAWPVAGAGYGLQPVAVICDAGGEAGVTPNAYRFFRSLRRSHPGRFRLVRGKPGEKVKRAEVKRPESAHQGKAHVARDIPLVWAGTDRLKDEVASALQREAGAPFRLAVPRDAPAEVFAEYAAERRAPDGWHKRPGCVRNEALDLSVYALALVIVLEAEAINWSNPPAWARPDGANRFAVASEPEAAPVAEDGPRSPDPLPAAPRPATKPTFVVKGSAARAGAKRNPWRR